MLYIYVINIILYIYIENINHLWKHLQSTSHLRSATCSIIPEGPKTWQTVAAELMLSGAKVSGLGSVVTGKSTKSPTKFGDVNGEII